VSFGNSIKDYDTGVGTPRRHLPVGVFLPNETTGGPRPRPRPKTRPKTRPKQKRKGKR